MSIAANIDINLRGSTAKLDKPLTDATKKVQSFALVTTTSVYAIRKAFDTLGNRVTQFIASFPGGSKIAEAGESAIGVFKSLGATLGGVGTTLGSLATGNFAGALKGLMDIGGGLKGMFTGLLDTVNALATAWIRMGMSAIPHIADINKLSDKLGISTQDVVALSEKAKMGLDELDPALTQLQRHLANPSPELDKMLRKIGLNSRDLVNMNFTEAIGKIGDSLDKVGNAADRTAIEMELAGRSGANLFRLFKGGSAGLDEARAKTEALGLSVSKVEAQRVAEAKGAMSNMNKAWEGLMRTAAISIAPVVTELSNMVTEGIKYFNRFRDEIGRWGLFLRHVLTNIGDYWSLTWKQMSLDLQKKVAEWIAYAKVFGRFMKEVATGNFDFKGAAHKAIVDKFYEDTDLMKTDPAYAKLQREVWALRVKLNQAFRALEAKKIEIPGENPPPSILNKEGGEKVQTNKAVEMGSEEAFSVIAKAQGDKMYKVVNEQLKEAKKHTKLLEDLRRKKNPIIVEAGRF